MLHFNIPGFYDHRTLNSYIIKKSIEVKDFLKPNVKIHSVFGVFPFCAWDGGRNFLSYEQCTKEDVIAINREYTEFGIPIRLVFTNPKIKEEHLHDRFCNMVLRECDNGINEIVVNSPLLEDYIRTNYPNYKLISSTTKRLGKTKVLDEIKNDNYFQVCLDYDLNKNLQLLEEIPMEYRDKVEFLSNAICPAHCGYRKQHYSATGQAQLTFLRDGYSVCGRCEIDKSINHPDKLGVGNNLSFEDMLKYNEMGYNYFKLEGRTLPSAAVLSNYLYYLINPKYLFDTIEEAATIDGIFVNDKNGILKGPVEVTEGIPFLNIIP